jgi:hypothetical protein
MEGQTMFAAQIRCFGAILCALVCLASPVALYAITMAFGAEKWRSNEEPVPVASYVMDVLFLIDLVSTVGLLCLVRGWWWFLSFVIAAPLLCLAGTIWLWGGLWVSGQWL